MLPERAPSAANAQPAAPAGRTRPVAALLVGAGIGVVLAAGNVYAGLKTGYIDGGSITAALLGSALLGLVGRRAPSTLDVNLTQTVAASAAVMSFAAGICAPIPALAMGGQVVSPAAIFGWGLGLGVLGVLLAWLLRRRLIEADALPFPTGQATAEVIETVSRKAGDARGRILSLGIAAAVAAAIALLRDGPPALLPPGFFPTVPVLGFAAASLTLGVSLSPLMVGTGILVGRRIGLSMGLGAALAWAGLAPAALRLGVAGEASYPALVPVLLWPGLALLVGSALTTLALSWATLRRSLTDLRLLLQAAGHSGRGVRLAALGTAALVPVLAIATGVFGIPVPVLVPLLPAALLLAAAAARAAGETDQAPVGQVGSLAQIAIGSQGYAPSLGGGALVAGLATQTAQTLWAFKAGHRLGHPPRTQMLAQLLGAAVGAAVVVPVYLLVRAAHPLGSAEMPAPAALAWRAASEAARGVLPLAQPLVWQVTLAAAVLGVLLTVLERIGPRALAGRLPSATALGAAFVLPAFMSFAILAGALLFGALARRRAAWADAHGPSLAAGGIAGESLMGLALAALAVAGR
jgi:uncharacterized oligopeptide transporter (OPT) family protein